MQSNRILRRIGEYLVVKSLIRETGAGANGLDYQPLPWLGLHEAARASGSSSRLSEIEKTLAEKGLSQCVILDVGSHCGYFSLKLAEKGYFVYGAESVRERVYLSFMAAQRVKGHFNPIALKIDRTNVGFLPDAEATLCLSIWHHWVRNFGLGDANAILGTIWKKTRRLLFFDAGEGEMGERYRLPYGKADDPSRYLEDYLRRLAGVKSVARLGTHQAFAPKDASGVRETVRRTLFCVEKEI